MFERRKPTLQDPLRREVNPAKLIKWLKRRSAIEPIFGHPKTDNRLDRNLLKGKGSNHINAILAACGFNLRKVYAVFLLPILKWLKNRLMKKYLLSNQTLREESFVIIPNNILFQ